MKPIMKNRSRAYIRHQRQRVINRKCQIAKQLFNYSPIPPTSPREYRWWHPPGSYAKGKIHCSCFLCAEKSKHHGFPFPERSRVAQMEKELFDYLHYGEH